MNAGVPNFISTKGHESSDRLITILGDFTGHDGTCL